MVKKEIITINGGLGSGKSSTSDLVAEKLDFRRFSSGDFFRQVGLELGLSLNEVNRKAESDPKIDMMVDNKLRQLRDAERIVIDSRMAFHWIPESFKVFLDLSPDIAKGRILKNIKENALRRQSEGQPASEEEVYAKMRERFESEQKRYRNFYKINNTDKNQYDMIVDTSTNNLEQVVDMIVREYRKWITQN